MGFLLWALHTIRDFTDSKILRPSSMEDLPTSKASALTVGRHCEPSYKLYYLYVKYSYSGPLETGLLRVGVESSSPFQETKILDKVCSVLDLCLMH